MRRALRQHRGPSAAIEAGSDVARARKSSDRWYSRLVAPTLEADPDCARPIARAGNAGGAGTAHEGKAVDQSADRAADVRPHPAADGAPVRSGDAQASSERPLRAEQRAFGDIDPATWDRLAFLNPYATPFSAWAFHRAWWDAYGENAHDETLVVIDPTAAAGTAAAAGADAPAAGTVDAASTAGPRVLSAASGQPIAIVPLMDRHVVEPTDAETHTAIRHGQAFPLTSVPAAACAVYFGASYHADYATVLAHPADMPRAAAALATALATDAVTPAPPAADPDHPEPWTAVDLRRIRQADPAADALATAFGGLEMAAGWTLNVEREDVCPVIRLPEGADFDAFLATLGKKERHEIRRKVRRAEAAGAVELIDSPDPLADLDSFIDLHQARWGERGLFPPTLGGDQSRHFIRRLFELFGEAAATNPAHPTIHLGFLMVGGRRIGAEIHFETAGSLMYYNAGIDPVARELSPGVVLLERLVRRAIERGKCRIDLLRGDEPYKYEWGAIDEPIQRILVRRDATRSPASAVTTSPR